MYHLFDAKHDEDSTLGRPVEAILTPLSAGADGLLRDPDDDLEAIHL